MNNNLLELYKLAIEKNYEFNYTVNENEENFLSIDKSEKIINITIGNYNSEDLPKIIDNLINDILK